MKVQPGHCPNCGEALPESGDAFCVFCHEPLELETSVATYQAVDESEIPSECPLCREPFGPDDIKIKRLPWIARIMPGLGHIFGSVLIFLVFLFMFKIPGVLLFGAFYITYLTYKPSRHRRVTIQCSNCDWGAKYATTQTENRSGVSR